LTAEGSERLRYSRKYFESRAKGSGRLRRPESGLQNPHRRFESARRLQHFRYESGPTWAVFALAASLRRRSSHAPECLLRSGFGMWITFSLAGKPQSWPVRQLGCYKVSGHPRCQIDSPSNDSPPSQRTNRGWPFQKWFRLGHCHAVLNGTLAPEYESSPSGFKRLVRSSPAWPILRQSGTEMAPQSMSGPPLRERCILAHRALPGSV
jgi:hypothetical protein